MSAFKFASCDILSIALFIDSISYACVLHTHVTACTQNPWQHLQPMKDSLSADTFSFLHSYLMTVIRSHVLLYPSQQSHGFNALVFPAGLDSRHSVSSTIPVRHQTWMTAGCRNACHPHYLEQLWRFLCWCLGPIDGRFSSPSSALPYYSE